MGKNERAKIVMTDDEIAQFIERSRTATFATVSATGAPHLVAMWYAVLDGEVWFETKAKSQKAVNLRRNPTVTVMVEDGLTYDTLRGVSIEARGEISDDPGMLLRVGISVWERYTGRRAGGAQAGAQLGSPQAGYGADAGGRQHCAVPGLRRT